MELKIYNPTEDGFIKAIEWNHEEIKHEVAEKVKLYANIVYTDNQIKEAKADRAKLNKFVKALEDKRKEIKKQCLTPYEDFEKKMKEIIAIVNEPIAIIDRQVKGYEDQKKAEKIEEIKKYWILQADKIPEVTLDAIFNQKWLNASVSMKSIQDEINAKLEQIKNDIATLENLPEFGFEAKEVYKSTLDVNKAINEAKRMSDIAKAKAEAEKKKQEESARQESVQLNEPIAEPIEEKEPEKEVARQWINFSALLSTQEALALKEFFVSRKIEFKAI